MFSCAKTIYFLLHFLFKEHTIVGILVHPSQVSYKNALNSVIGAFKVRVKCDLIYVLETHIYGSAKDQQKVKIFLSQLYESRKLVRRPSLQTRQRMMSQQIREVAVGIKNRRKIPKIFRRWN